MRQLEASRLTLDFQRCQANLTAIVRPPVLGSSDDMEWGVGAAGDDDGGNNGAIWACLWLARGLCLWLQGSICVLGSLSFACVVLVLLGCGLIS
jgi:hypothetical protein